MLWSRHFKQSVSTAVACASVLVGAVCAIAAIDYVLSALLPLYALVTVLYAYFTIRRRYVHDCGRALKVRVRCSTVIKHATTCVDLRRQFNGALLSAAMLSTAQSSPLCVLSTSPQLIESQMPSCSQRTWRFHFSLLSSSIGRNAGR